ncbi:MAG: TFIIB-type zinc ribbon-containing protein [Candidatus Metalachnospira sp.]|nr:TFIIB-type zinc ribbon-containing protein [Candidatus Metalachnospira sp.]
MDTFMYRCANCGGALEYDANTHIFHCDYCLSDFTAEELEEIKLKKEEEKGRLENEKAAFEEHAVLYNCPSCGAEIITDDTTTATFCYYCHSPVVLSGKMTGDMKPGYIIPFKIDRDEAEKRFFEWVKRKKFLPKDFVNEKSVEKMCGVYYPYWLSDCTVHGRYSASGKNLRIWIAGDIEYTETKIFDITREGTIVFDNIKNFAMSGDKVKLATAVQPFRDEEMEKFNMAYLSGFMAEKRTVETDAMGEQLKEQVNKYATRLLDDSVSGYNIVDSKNVDIDMLDTKWDYVLLPVWVLTYISNGKIYYYALNGQTGKAVGELPVNKPKLILFAVIIFLVFFLIVVLIGGLLI